jgi:hypothetical protein
MKAPKSVGWSFKPAKPRRASYHSRGLQSGSPRGPFLKDMDGIAYNKHATQKRHVELCRLFGIKKEHVFLPHDAGDPKLATMDRAQELYELNYNSNTRFLRFSFYFLTGDAESEHNLSHHFQGQEHFLVERRKDYIRRSTIYSTKEHLFLLHKLNRLSWVVKIPVT